MKTLPIIHKEHFEAWLFSQPDERMFAYGDCAHCVGATFMLESHRTRTIWGHSTYSLHETVDHRAIGYLPDWLYGFLYGAFRTHGNYLLVADLKSDWRKLFPEPLSPVLQEQVSATDGPVSCEYLAGSSVVLEEA